MSEAAGADGMLLATVWICSECGQPSVREQWDIASSLMLRRLRRQIESGEINADDVWLDTEVAVCPRCKFEHHDNESSWVDEQRCPVVVPAIGRVA